MRIARSVSADWVQAARSLQQLSQSPRNPRGRPDRPFHRNLDGLPGASPRRDVAAAECGLRRRVSTITNDPLRRAPQGVAQPRPGASRPQPKPRGLPAKIMRFLAILAHPRQRHFASRKRKELIRKITLFEQVRISELLVYGPRTNRSPKEILRISERKSKLI